MKFTNGYWLIRPEYQMSYAVEYYRSSRTDSMLKVLAPCRPIQERGATVGGEALTVQFSAPMKALFRLTLRTLPARRTRDLTFPSTASRLHPNSAKTMSR